MTAMHERFEARRQSLLNCYGKLRTRGVRQPEAWESFRLPGQEPYAPKPATPTRLQTCKSVAELRQMSAEEQDKYFHELTLRNVAAYQRNKNQV